MTTIDDIIAARLAQAIAQHEAAYHAQPPTPEPAPDPTPDPTPDQPPDPEPEPPTPTPDPEPPTPPSGSGNILGIDLAALPRSGAAYERVRALASKSAKLNLGDLNGPGNATLLAKAALGDREGVLSMVRAGTVPDWASVNSLAASRNLAAWAIALNLVGAHDEDDWLRQARDATYGNFGSMVYPGGAAAKANNHGSAADMSVTAIDLHLGDRAHLEAKVLPVWRTRLMEPGHTVDGQPVSLNGPKDADRIDGRIVVVGPEDYTVDGVDADGLLMEEQRRSSPFPNCGNYNFGASGQFLLTAWLLHEAGYPVLAWGDQAIRRIFEALNRLGCTPSGDDAWQGHMAAALFGAMYIPLGVGDGKSFGLTDYLMAQP